jgi:hypothetical protein
MVTIIDLSISIQIDVNNLFFFFSSTRTSAISGLMLLIKIRKGWKQQENNEFVS